MRNIRVYDKILKKYIPFNGAYSFNDPTLVFEEGTGVKDLNKQETFVGDIIQITAGFHVNHTGNIIYQDYTAAYVIKLPHFLTERLGNFNFPVCHFKIIGNIHE